MANTNINTQTYIHCLSLLFIPTLKQPLQINGSSKQEELKSTTTMPSRPFPPSPSPSKTRVLFLVLTISASTVFIFAFLYFLYYLWYSLLAQRSRTIPFDSTAPLKLQRFTYRELKIASSDFHDANIIGKGGSCTVFRGTMKDGKLIAIKKLDGLSLQTEREFRNEVQILGGLWSPFLVPLLGFCVDKNKRILVYEYVPNHSLQESLFGDGHLNNLSWERRFSIILDVATALEFLHLGCDPPVIHGDIKPSNVLLDSDFRARISDFGLSRIKAEGEFGMDLFSQELSGTLAAVDTPAESAIEVDSALALQTSSSSKNSRTCSNVKGFNLNSNSYNNANIASDSDVKGKEVSSLDVVGEDWDSFVPCEDELSIVNHSKELNSSTKQWGEDWWWRQDGSGELCSKDYVKEWIGSQICASTTPDRDEAKQCIPETNGLENPEKEVEGKGSKGKKNVKKKHRKMQEWWEEENLAEINKKGDKLRNLEAKWKKGFKMSRFDLTRCLKLRRRKKFGERDQSYYDTNVEFSFRRGWKKRDNCSFGSEMWSGDLISRELSSTTSMRGTLCYVAPEYGGSGYLMEKADIYSLGVLILVIVSGRRPLHVLASPMKLEKANLISWCRQLAQAGNILELVDEKLKEDYNKDQASLSINLALACLQKMPELRPDIGEVLKILKGEMDLPPMPFEFFPSPPSRLYSRSETKHKANTE